MKEENKEIKYGYVIEFSEYPKSLVSELDNIYSSKEECLKEAKEEISRLYNSFDYAYIYVLPLCKTNIGIENNIIDEIIYMVQESNDEYIFDAGSMYDNKEKLKEVIKNCFNKYNDWNYIEVVEDNIEVYKANIRRKIDIDIEEVQQ